MDYFSNERSGRSERSEEMSFAEERELSKANYKKRGLELAQEDRITTTKTIVVFSLIVLIFAILSGFVLAEEIAKGEEINWSRVFRPFEPFLFVGLLVLITAIILVGGVCLANLVHCITYKICKKTYNWSWDMYWPD